MSNVKKIKISAARKATGPRGMFAVVGVAMAALFLNMQEAFAQTASTPAPSREFDEVVVVARRTEEFIQSVPLAITVLSGAAIESRSISGAQDLAGLVPSLSVQRGGLGASPNFSLRGIRTGVSSYFAEIPLASQASIELQLWDLASVQAIAGPQGTLFGKNSTGGAVLFVPKAPTNEFEGYVKGTIGNYSYKETEAVVNVPVNDMLQLRLGAQLTDRDGLVENISGPDLQDLNRQAYRLSVAFQPTDWLENDTVLNYSEFDEHAAVQINQSGAVATAAINNPLSPINLSYGRTAYPQALRAQDARGQRKVDLPYPHFKNEHRFNLSNIMTADFDAFTAKYIAGYAENGGDTFTSSSSIALPLVVGGTDISEKTLTQEVQFSGSTFDDLLDFQVGGFYSHREQPFSDSSFITFGRPATLVVTDPINPLAASIANSELDEKSKAVYGQFTLHPTSDLALTAGLRYTRDKKEDVNTSKNPGNRCSLSNIPSVNLATCVQTLDDEFSAVTYNLSADYTISPNQLVYAATRRGYNAGGHNINIQAANETYDPEFITDYEIGLKSDWHLGGVPIRSNLAAFYADYKDIQRRVVVIVPGPPPRPQMATSNAASATLYGAQFDIFANPTPELRLGISYGYVHSKYDSFVDALVGDVSGNEFAQAPEHTASLSASYTVNLPEGSVVASANYQYISSQLSDDINIGIPEAEMPGYGIMDARIDWKSVFGSSLDIAIFGKNLNDKLYRINTSVAASLGTVTNIYGDPRTYGLEMKYGF